MKKVILIARISSAVIALVALLALAVTAPHRHTGSDVAYGQVMGGPLHRDLYVPSVWHIFFGDNTTTDVTLQKVAPNVLGVVGNLGGGGLVANTTTAPAGPFAWGQVTLAANTATVVFTKPFVNAPVCFATDQTTPQLVKASATATQVVLTDTVGATDSVSWFCLGNPN